MEKDNENRAKLAKQADQTREISALTDSIFRLNGDTDVMEKRLKIKQEKAMAEFNEDTKIDIEFCAHESDEAHKIYRELLKVNQDELKQRREYLQKTKDEGDYDAIMAAYRNYEDRRSEPVLENPNDKKFAEKFELSKKLADATKKKMQDKLISIENFAELVQAYFKVHPKQASLTPILPASNGPLLEILDTLNSKSKISDIASQTILSKDLEILRKIHDKIPEAKRAPLQETMNAIDQLSMNIKQARDIQEKIVDYALFALLDNSDTGANPPDPQAIEKIKAANTNSVNLIKSSEEIMKALLPLMKKKSMCEEIKKDEERKTGEKNGPLFEPSSSYNNNELVNFQLKNTVPGKACWAPRENTQGQFMSFRFTKEKVFAEIQTQGRGLLDPAEFVSAFTIQFLINDKWVDSTLGELVGNSDKDTVKQNDLKLTRAKGIKILPKAAGGFTNRMSMRVDLIYYD